MIYKLRDLLSAVERKRFVYTVLAAIVMAVLELVGIGAIVSFMGVLSQPSLIEGNQWYQRAYTYFEVESDKQFIVLIGLGLLAVFLIRNLFSVFVVWLQLRFCWDVLYSISSRLLKRYLYLPYTYFLTNNSARIKKNMLSEMRHLLNGVIMPAMQLITNSIIALSIFGLLLWHNPLFALIVTSLLGGVYVLAYLIIRGKLGEMGVGRSLANKKCYKTLDEALSGIKEISILGRQGYFLDAFLNALGRYSYYMRRGKYLRMAPNYFIDILIFGGVFGVAIYLTAFSANASKSIQLITLYAIAGYRILPAIRNIITSLSALRFNRKSLEVIYADYELDVDPNKSKTLSELRLTPLPFEHAICLNDVSYKYPQAEADAISNVSLSIACHSTVGFVGATGAGKSTVSDLILGVLRAKKGAVCVDGIEIDEQNAACWQANIGYVPQQIYLSDNTVTNNIAFGIKAEEIDFDEVVRAAKVAHIYNFIINDLPGGFDAYVGEKGIRLSGGQRQRIAIARALYKNPDVLVFDEATSSLDNETERIINQSISDLAGTKTIIIIAHRMSTLKSCDVIYVFERGKQIASGNYRELVEGCESFKRLASISV